MSPLIRLSTPLSPVPVLVPVPRVLLRVPVPRVVPLLVLGLMMIRPDVLRLINPSVRLGYIPM